MKNILQVILQEFLGKPYSTYDCFQLVSEFYKRYYNVNIDFLRDPSLSREDNIDSGKSYFKRVKLPKFGDIVTMDDRGVEAHVGIYIDNGLILHSTSKKGVVLERAGVLKVRGYYRWQE